MHLCPLESLLNQLISLGALRASVLRDRKWNTSFLRIGWKLAHCYFYILLKTATEVIQNQDVDIDPTVYEGVSKKFVAIFNLPQVLLAKHCAKSL